MELSSFIQDCESLEERFFICCYYFFQLWVNGNYGTQDLNPASRRNLHNWFAAWISWKQKIDKDKIENQSFMLTEHLILRLAYNLLDHILFINVLYTQLCSSRILNIIYWFEESNNLRLESHGNLNWLIGNPRYTKNKKEEE